MLRRLVSGLEQAVNGLIGGLLQLYLDFGGLRRRPLHQRDSSTQHEDGEPLQAAQRAAEHQHRTQRRTGDLQLIRHLTHRRQRKLTFPPFSELKPAESIHSHEKYVCQHETIFSHNLSQTGYSTRETGRARFHMTDSCVTNKTNS